MTRFERLIDMDVEDVAALLCDAISDKVDCENCPATDKCRRGHNGMLDWLNEEVQDAE